MELVVDANILFSFFKPESFTRELIKTMFIRNVRLFIPEFALDELFGLRERICKYCGITEMDFEISLALLYEMLQIVPAEEFTGFLPEALGLLPNHTKDPIWSNEKRFKEQSKVTVFSTSELKERYGE